MSYSSAITEVKLMHTFTSKKHQLFFSSRSECDNYYTNTYGETITNFSFIKKNKNVINVDGNAENFQRYNYLRYKNPEADMFTYCFITNIEWVSDSTAAIYFEIDVFQTYFYFQTTAIAPCFVVREHVSAANEDIHKNLVNEGLEYGDIVTNSSEKAFKNLETTPASANYTNFWLCYIMSDKIESTDPPPISYIDGLPNECYLYLIDYANSTVFTDHLNTLGKGGAIIAAVLFPKFLASMTLLNSNYGYGVPEFYQNPYKGDFVNIPYPTTVNGYTPRNKKLLHYPYSFVRISNNNGNSKDYKYEYSSENYGLIFEPVFSFSANPTMIIYPTHYKGKLTETDEALTFTNFPQIAFSYDTFKNWLALNANSLAFQSAQSAINIGAGIGTQNYGQALSGASGIMSQLVQISDNAKIPDTIKGNVSGNMQASLNNIDFVVMQKSITAEFAIRIDNYFTMYGYKVNTVKVPELHSRANFNYIQTIGFSLYLPQFPQNHIRELEKLFDDGITLWHASSSRTKLDYFDGVNTPL
jgi:hypothetical protein